MHQFLFYASLLSALLGWFFLIVAPTSKLTARIVDSKLLHGLVCVFYTIAVFTTEGVPESAGFFSVSGVLDLFESEDAIVAAWLHIIVFDFFVGTWIFEDASKQRLGHIWVVSILLTTIILGPLGLLIYLLVRSRKNAVHAS